MPVSNPDWMSECANPLYDLPLCRIPLPGSHDAGSYGGEMAARSRTQEHAIGDQLFFGVRYFDFRVKVDNGVFFSHHGHDDSRGNKYARATPETDGSWIFNDIAWFCNNYPGEIVILNFTDFTAVPGQSFNEQDKKDFMEALRRHFGSLLILRPRTGIGWSHRIPTYGECIGNGRRVLVIINEDVPVWSGHQDVWQAKHCWRDRFSAYRYTLHSWSALVDDTLADQQDYLASTGTTGRDLDRFWVSQAILAYDNTTTPGGSSENKAGAAHLNGPFSDAYRHWWAGESAIPGKTQSVQTPNVLLLDYSAVYDNFAGVCKDLLLAPTPASSPPVLA